MNELGNVFMWRGKLIEELTHAECVSCIKTMAVRLQELESIPIDWRKHARDKFGLTE